MSLKIIYGKAKTGKTAKCLDLITEIINKTQDKIVYIVPEQYSLEAERNISARFSKTANDRVEVLSFELLAGRVFSKVGPVICNYLDDNAKVMLIEKAILKHSSQFLYFGKSSGSSDFASVIYDCIKTFRKNSISPDILKNIAEEIENKTLKLKLNDILLIYSEYEKAFKPPVFDSDNKYPLLCEKISEFGIFRDAHIVFDNYISFTKQQLEVIEALMKNCPEMIVSLTTDTLNPTDRYNLFYKSSKTAQVLYGIAKANDIEIKPCTYLEKSYETNKEFLHLQENYFGRGKNIFKDKTNSLFVCQGKNLTEEIAQVSAEILRLVRDEGYRFKDISVITRSGDVYYPIIRDVFERYNINYNITEPMLSTGNFLYGALISLFEIVSSNYAFAPVFDYIRSPLCRLDEYDKYLLENFVIESGNRKNLWTDEKPVSPKGTCYATNHHLEDEFKQISNSLEFVKKELRVFTDKFKGRKTVVDIVYAYKDFLNYIDAKTTVSKIVQYHKNNGDTAFSQEIVSVYNSFVLVLNQMIQYFGDENITFEKFYKILKSGLSTVKIGLLPSGVDDVQITSIDRFTALNSKIVFAVGLSDGSIPCGYINDGIITDGELAMLGIEETVQQTHLDENYVIYRLFSSATEKLYLSYPVSDNEGNKSAPSVIIPKVMQLFPNITIIQNIYETLNSLTEIDATIPTFNRLLTHENEGIWDEVRLWYKENAPEYYSILKQATEYCNQPLPLPKETIDKLYGKDIKTSISRIERYNQCAYAYFLRYGLNVDVRKEAKIEANDYGTYFHEIIETYSNFAQEIGWKTITDDTCFAKVSEITNEVLTKYLGEIHLETPRGRYTIKKITKIMQTCLKNITDFYKDSDYISLGYEIEFDDNGEYGSIPVILSDGRCVKLTGKIDRADIMRTPNGNFVSVVDYKSSSKNIELGKVLCGIQIQLPIYIKAVCDSMNNNGEKAIPASMLYYTIDDPTISAEKSVPREVIEKELKKSLRMNGLTTEEGELPGIYSVKANANTRQLELICQTAFNKVKDSLDKILSGEISISPSYIDGSTACDYCPYSNVCNFDESFKDNSYRHYNKIKMEEFLDNVDKMD